MRGYAKVAPQFWIGSTGKRIRAIGTEAQLLALYLMTGPHANMIGLYYLPVSYICADTGLPMEGASKTLNSLIEVGFCAYDYESEVIWVYEMAKWQVGESLKPNDKQCGGVRNEYAQLPKNAYLIDFFDRYQAAFHLQSKRDASPSDAPQQAPPKPLRSKEQEQEHEQDLVPNGTCRSDERPEEFADLWNRLRGPLPRVKDFTDSRRRKVKTRMTQGLTMAKFEEVIKRCLDTPFLTGDNDRGWQVHFDFLVENDTNITKVMEGEYGRGRRAPVVNANPVAPTQEKWEENQRRKAQEELETFEVWNSMSQSYKQANPWKGRQELLKQAVA